MAKIRSEFYPCSQVGASPKPFCFQQKGYALGLPQGSNKIENLAALLLPVNSPTSKLLLLCKGADCHEPEVSFYQSQCIKV